MSRRGITLVELMVALAGTAILSAAMLNAYEKAIKVGPALRASQANLDAKLAFKDKVTELLHHVYVLNSGATAAPAATGAVSSGTTSTSFTTIVAPGATATTATGPRTYFTTNPQSGNSGLSQSSGGASQSSSGSGGSTSELVFTVLGEPTSNAALQDASNDFTQQNITRGPEGGIVEYQIGITPVGTAPQGKKGVFLRQQRPADTDPTQGGYESLLMPDVDNILFEFWDGTQWQQSWDTTTQTPIRLPAAVRVSYSKGSETPTVFVVQIPLSDATPADPVTNLGGGISGGTP
jgi:Tfp pilus assembly protein PilE